MYRHVIICLVVILLLAQCAPPPVYHAKNFPQPRTIAILPVDNETVDVDGGLLLRKMVAVYLKHKKKKTFIQSIATTDSILREMGITDGGQLTFVGESELLDSLGVEGLLFLRLLNSDYKISGFFETKEVRIEARIMTRDGLYWWDSRVAKETESHLDDIFEDADDAGDVLKKWLGQVGEDLAEKTARSALLKHPLYPEFKEAVHNLFRRCPL